MKTFEIPDQRHFVSGELNVEFVSLIYWIGCLKGIFYVTGSKVKMNQSANGFGFFSKLANQLRHWDRWLNGSHWRPVTYDDFESLSVYRFLKFLFRSKKNVYVFLQIILPQGHALIGLWLGIFLSIALIFGPTPSTRGDWNWLLVPAIGLLLATNYFLRVERESRFFGERYLGFAQFVSLALFALVVWFLAPRHSVEAGTSLYFHIVVPAVILVLFVLLLNKILAKRLFRQMNYSGRLARIELFVNPEDRSDNWKDFIRSVSVVPFTRPLEILLPASLWVLVQADHLWMKVGFFVLLGIAWVLLAAAHGAPRLREAMDTFGRWFFVGVPRAVTVLVILIALLRLADVGYVSTLIEASPEATNRVFWMFDDVNVTILTYVVVTYIVFWFYAYWSNRFLGEEIIRMFQSPSQSTLDSTGQTEYELDSSASDAKIKVEDSNRMLQIHGASRFTVVGHLTSPRHLKEAFHFYDAEGLVRAVLNPEKSISSQSAYEADRVCQRIQFYTVVPTGILVCIAALFFFWAASVAQAPQLVVDGSPPSKFNLQEALFGDVDSCGNARSSDTPRILIAGSGGGTRAALHSAAVLRGLAQAGHGCNISLVSGVSGSSAAFAYFAGSPNLRQGYDSAAWDQYSRAMASPFIQDVLEGLPEWRIVGVKDAGYREFRHAEEASESEDVLLGFRAGHLLAESFEERFASLSARTLGEVDGLGVMFNTTITGSFPRGAPQEMETIDRSCLDEHKDLTLPEREASCKAIRSAKASGGRLIMTNLDAGAFPMGAPYAAPNERVVHAVLRDSDIPLTRAAALSANFPPVFSNAAIDVYDSPHSAEGVRYWVTDGGAMDNRGLIPVLYALRQAIEDEVAENNSSAARTIPPIHIVVAEASATGLSFSQDRGIGAGLGSKEKLAAQLINELTCQIEGLSGSTIPGAAPCDSSAQSEGITKIQLHYLSMPTVFRDGGLGTHWMMPATVKLKRPLGVPEFGGKEKSEAKLTGKQTRRLIEQLYLSGEGVDVCAKSTDSITQGKLDRVRRWIRDDTYRNYCAVWGGLAKGLKFDSATN
ncbi:MAG: hypothetical protein AAF420_02285 [Pseudomonadota bacterium]